MNKDNLDLLDLCQNVFCKHVCPTKAHFYFKQLQKNIQGYLIYSLQINVSRTHAQVDATMYVIGELRVNMALKQNCY